MTAAVPTIWQNHSKYLIKKKAKQLNITSRVSRLKINKENIPEDEDAVDPAAAAPVLWQNHSRYLIKKATELNIRSRVSRLKINQGELA